MFPTPRHAVSVAALLLLLAGAAAPPAGACGFDGLLDGNFGAQHPRSVAVAFAVRDAIDAGLIETTAANPVTPGSAGYWRAIGHLNALLERMTVAAVNAPPPPSIAVLFIDSNLWSRLRPAPDGFAITVHTPGAEPNDVVVVTSEPILAVLLDRRLTIEAALERGLVIVDGNGTATDAVQHLIRAAFKTDAVTPRQPLRRFFGWLRPAKRAASEH